MNGALTIPDARLVPSIRTIERVTRETADVFTWRLSSVGAPWSPGQFNMLYLFGAGEVAVSISGDPARTGELVHTIRAVGAVTTAMQRLKKGAPIGVRGPFGRGWPMHETEGHDLLIIAGGLGLAPLRPAISHALSHRARYGKVAILIGARSPDDLLFQKDVARWRAQLDVTVGVTVDHAPPSYRGDVGVVTSLLPALALDPARTHAFLCGPEIMMRYAARDLRKRGFSEQQLWVSLERNMGCGIGVCGRCQLGPHLLCVHGPVFRLDHVSGALAVREL